MGEGYRYKILTIVKSIISYLVYSFRKRNGSYWRLAECALPDFYYGISPALILYLTRDNHG